MNNKTNFTDLEAGKGLVSGGPALLLQDGTLLLHLPGGGTLCPALEGTLCWKGLKHQRLPPAALSSGIRAQSHLAGLLAPT
jgi:hypothetical protein